MFCRFICLLNICQAVSCVCCHSALFGRFNKSVLCSGGWLILTIVLTFLVLGLESTVFHYMAMPWFIKLSCWWLFGLCLLGTLHDTATASARIHFCWGKNVEFPSLTCWAFILTRHYQIHFQVAHLLCLHTSSVSVFWRLSILPDTGVFYFWEWHFQCGT